MRRIDRFDKYMKYCGLNDNKVTIQLGLTVGVIGKSRKEGRDLSDKVIEEILNYYTDINRVWLLTGEGNMLKEESVYTNSENTNQQLDDMNASVFLRALAEEQSLTREALAQNARLIGIIERLHGIGIDDVYARISPPLQNQDQNCLK